MPDERRVDVAFGLEELGSLADALVQRLREGSLPPDDAYWWARIVARDAHDFAALEPNDDP